MSVLSKRALKYIEYTISEFSKKGEIVTNQNTSVKTYEKASKVLNKMVKNLHKKPEKYLDMDYLDDEKIEQLEAEAKAWEEEQRGKSY